MQVLFDWELDDKLKTPLHTWVYEELRTFIKARFKPFEDEVDERKEGEVAFVCVIWHEGGAIETKYFFIPDDLIKKLSESLTQDDMDYIMNTIGQKIGNKSKEN